MMEKMSANPPSVALLCRGLVYMLEVLCHSVAMRFVGKYLLHTNIYFLKLIKQENCCEAGILCND